MSLDAALDANQTQATQYYGEGLKHLQSGRWQEAIQALDIATQLAPSDARIADKLEEARFRSRFEATVRVRPRRWIISWRSVLVRALLVVVIALGAFLAAQTIRTRVAPEVKAAQAKQQLNGALLAGARYVEAGDLPNARAAYARVLIEQPDNQEAHTQLAQIERLESLSALYGDAVAAQQAGQFQLALERLTTIQQLNSDYKDVVTRIRSIRQSMDEEVLFAEAEEAVRNGKCQFAIVSYRDLQTLNEGFRHDLIASRLFDCYVALAQEIIAAQPPTPHRLPEARDYLVQALAIRPRDLGASTEERLVSLYLAGQVAFDARNWAEVVRCFDAVYQQRPDYQGGAFVAQLYDAHVASGDGFAASERYADAWNQYDRALRLPVSNRVVADERRARMAPMITPTPTPTNTPTATPIPTPTPYIYVPPTPLPSATPVPPLATFRNQIIFRSDKEDQSGFWAMNPDGSNRRYVGSSPDVQKQYDELIRREMRSPDGRCRVYTLKGKGDTYPQIYTQCEGNQPGEVWTRQLTYLAGITYDPVWAPDGSRIAFVSQDRGSDDLWIINPDGTNLWNYTPNEWEWDKHPSWSPDSRKLVFWSNREGTKQIYAIDADGRNMKKIFATTWDEYDPIWVK